MASLTHSLAVTLPMAATHDDIRRTLVDWQRDLLNQIQSTIRDVREEGGINRAHQNVDAREATEVDPDDDLPFALMQMKTEVLTRINQAVRRLEEGTYGKCTDCAEAIASSRLRALPFAVRCRDCEEVREQSERRRTGARHLGSHTRVDLEN